MYQNFRGAGHRGRLGTLTAMRDTVILASICFLIFIVAAALIGYFPLIVHFAGGDGNRIRKSDASPHTLEISACARARNH